MSSPDQQPTIAILSLSIRDFRGIDRLELDFRGPDGRPNSLVVIAGPNGCGKTAVLEAALILAGGPKLITGLRGDRAVRRGAKDYAISAEFQIGPGKLFSRDDNRISSPPLFSRDDNRISSLPLSDHPVSHWYFSSWRAPALVGPVDPSVGQRGRRPANTDENRLLNVKQRLVNAAAVERFEGPRFPEFNRYSAVIKEINDAWREFYPDTDYAFEVGVVVTAEKSEGGSFEDPSGVAS